MCDEWRRIYCTAEMLSIRNHLVCQQSRKHNMRTFVGIVSMVWVNDKNGLGKMTSCMQSILSDVFQSVSLHTVHTHTACSFFSSLCSCLVWRLMEWFDIFNNAGRVQNTNTHIMRHLTTALLLTWDTKWSDVWKPRPCAPHAGSNRLKY